MTYWLNGWMMSVLNDFNEWSRENPVRAALAIAGVLGVVLVLGAIFGGGDEDPLAIDTTPTTLTPITAAPPASSGELAGADSVNCASLLTTGEVEQALGLTDPTGPLPFLLERSESCLHSMIDDEDLYVIIGPSSPDVFLQGATQMGVTGEPVTGLGEAALWFGGPQAEDAGRVGVLAVRVATPLGVLHFHVVLGRPDLDSNDQLEIARGLAMAALPRFPGLEEEPPEPVEVTIEPAPADVSNQGFLGNLLAKEADGEWTLGEGLVATLRLFVGELQPADVLRQQDLADYSDTEVLALAADFLETGSDEQVKTEIRRLIPLAVPTRDLLEGASEVPDSSVSGRYLLVSADLTVQEDGGETPQEWCMRVFGVDAPCLTGYTPPPDETPPPDDDSDQGEEPDPEVDGGPIKYLVYSPADGAGGWTQEHAEWALEAMLESAALYETLGDMPPTTVTLWALGHNSSELDPETGECSISLRPLARDPIEVGGPVKGPFQQRVAGRMAVCLLRRAGTFSAWWGQGMAVYLSGVVYPNVNLEHLLGPAFLEHDEPITGLLDRKLTGWTFWERLHPRNGPAGNLSFGFSPLSTIAEEFHLMSEDLTDVTIPDVGGGVVPYNPPSEPREIGGPTRIDVKPGHFGLKRLALTVPADKVVCEVEYDHQGGVVASWRSGSPGTSGGSWSQSLPDSPSGEMVFVVTGQVDTSQLTMDFKKVEDADDGCEEDEETPPGSGEPPCCQSEYYWNP